MKVYEFYEKNNKVFTEEVLQKYSFIDDVIKETELLNFFFTDKFGNCEITAENTVTASFAADMVLLKMNEYLTSIYDSILIKFDPLELSKIKDEIKKTGTNTNKIEYNSTVNVESYSDLTPNTTTTTSERTFDSQDILDIGKITNGGNEHTEANNGTTRSGDDTTTNTFNTTDTHIKTGYENIDYEKAISSLYKTKEINLYEIILNSVFDVICVPIYWF